MALLISLSAVTAYAGTVPGYEVASKEYTGTVKAGKRIMTMSHSHNLEAGQEILIEGGSDNAEDGYWFLTEVKAVKNNRVRLVKPVDIDVIEGRVLKVIAYEPIVEEPVVEEPVVEEPVVEEPVVEGPIIEPPVVEEPVIETPIVVDSADGIYLSNAADISGSITDYTGNINAGSNVLALSTSNHDFKVGHGISIEGAGNSNETNNWLVTKVTAVNGNQLTLSSSAAGSATGTSVIHDDTQAVNAVISRGSGTYYFDIEHMNVKGLQLQSNAVYDGMGTCTLYMPMTYSAVSYVQQMIEIERKTNVTFRNFTVDGNKSKGLFGTTQVGVMMIKSTFSSEINILNNTFMNSAFSAVNFRSTNSDILVEGNTILNVDVGIYAMPEWGGDLNLENAVYRNNYIDGGTSEAISISSGMWNNKGTVNNILIENNVMKNKSATALQLGSRTTNITVRNNEISHSNHGITTLDSNLEQLENLIARNIRIIGNKIHDNTWHNLIMDGYDVYIADNEIYNGNDTMLLGFNYLSGATVENNTFTNAGTVFGALSIFSADNAAINGNTFRSGNVAIEVRGGSQSNLQIGTNDLGGMSVRY